MCGRYYSDENNIEIQKILRCLRYSENEKPVKNGEIYPGNSVAVITADSNEKPLITAAQWGFPFQNSNKLIINGKAETAASKKMFSYLLKNNRCCIPASGFFEWSAAPEKKKFYFNSKNGGIIYLAGLWLPACETKRFIILTTAANETVSPVHSRMPLLIDKSEVRLWINNSVFANNCLTSQMPLLKCTEAAV